MRAAPMAGAQFEEVLALFLAHTHTVPLSLHTLSFPLSLSCSLALSLSICRRGGACGAEGGLALRGGPRFRSVLLAHTYTHTHTHTHARTHSLLFSPHTLSLPVSPVRSLSLSLSLSLSIDGVVRAAPRAGAQFEEVLSHTHSRSLAHKPSLSLFLSL